MNTYRAVAKDRSHLHIALDAILDAFDEYRRVPAEEDFVKLADIKLEAKAKRDLVRGSWLKVVKIGRELYTRRSYVASLVDVLPAVGVAGSTDDLVEAATKRATKGARR